MSPAAGMVLSVTEVPAVRQKPRGNDELADLTLIVRPHGRPWDIRTFTEDRRAEATAYAEQNGVEVESLPLTHP